MNVVNQYSHEGQEIEILDNMTFEIEQNMILKSLAQEQKDQVILHKDIWSKLLG